MASSCMGRVFKLRPWRLLGATVWCECACLNCDHPPGAFRVLYTLLQVVSYRLFCKEAIWRIRSDNAGIFSSFTILVVKDRIAMSRVAFRRFSSFLHIRGGVTRSRLVADDVIPLSHSSRIPLLLMLFLLCPVLLVVLCISLFSLNKCFFFTRTSRTNEDFKRATASILVKALRTIQKASDICQDSNYATSLVGEKGYRKV